MSAAILIAFNVAVMGITVMLGIFVSVNIPLIVFDKSMQVFNFISGGNLINDLLFNKGQVNWSLNNIFFVIYLSLVVLSIIVGAAILIKRTSTAAFGLSELETKKKNNAKWILNYFFGIFLIPLCFFLLNALSSSISLLWTNSSAGNTPISLSVILSSIRTNISTSEALSADLKNLITELTNKKGDIVDQNITDIATLNNAITSLQTALDSNNENINRLNQLLSIVSDEKLTNYQITYLNNSYNNIVSINSSINQYWGYNFDFNVTTSTDDTVSKPFQQILDYQTKLKSSQEDYGTLMKSNGDTFVRLDEIAWRNDNSQYKTSSITVQLTELVFGTKIYDLYSPYLLSALFTGKALYALIGGAFDSNIWISLVKMIVFIPAISICAGIMFNIILKVFKRAIEIIILLLTSPVVSVASISDDGAKWNTWASTSLSKFMFIAIASFMLMIYKMVFPEVIGYMSKINFGDSASTDVNVMKVILVMALFVGLTYGMNEMINFSSGLIGERNVIDRTANFGKAGSSAQGFFAVSRRNRRRSISRQMNSDSFGEITEKIGNIAKSTGGRIKAKMGR